MHENISVPLIDLHDARGNILTQLRQGERVHILERKADRLHVEALDQNQFTDSWHGYRGWITSGTTQPWREVVVAAARKCLGWTYLWGGLGDGAIDCSGLVHLAYRAAGIAIPRDARDQARWCEPVETLEPADLVFMAKRKAPEKIVHVMLYEDEGRFIEATSFTGNVRRIDLETRLTQPDSRWHHQKMRLTDRAFLL